MTVTAAGTASIGNMQDDRFSNVGGVTGRAGQPACKAFVDPCLHRARRAGWRAILEIT